MMSVKFGELVIIGQYGGQCHFSCLYWDQLGEIFTRRKDDPEALFILVTELGFRKRKKAIQLQKAVIVRLNELTRDCFPWPDIEAPLGKKNLKSDWPETGLLRFMSYTVGVNGIGRRRREEILDSVFKSVLPNINSPDYMKQWGSPDTAKRLRKIAKSIAALIRNAKRNSMDLSLAIRHWTNDLDYLHGKYYVGRFDFHWPHLDP